MTWIKSSHTPPPTSPTSGPFLADVGYPWPVIITWNQYQQEFVYPSLQINMMDGEYNDPYWENDYEPLSEIIAWQHLPQIIREL